VWRTVKKRELEVRGMVDVPALGTVEARDFEAPFDLEASYRVQQFDSLGNFVSWSTPSTATLAGTGKQKAWIHNPLDPSTSLQLTMLAGAGASISRGINAEIMQVKYRSVGVAIFGTRSGVSKVQLDCLTETEADADAFDEMFGLYNDTTTMRLPSPLFALVGTPTQLPQDFAHGGESTAWSLQGDEVSPPPEAIITALLGYDDFTAFYTDYAAFTAAYSDYQQATLDYSIEGTA
jgi:hypothetical protein